MPKPKRWFKSTLIPKTGVILGSDGVEWREEGEAVGRVGKGVVGDFPKYTRLAHNIR